MNPVEDLSERLLQLAGDWRGPECFHPSPFDEQGSERQGRLLLRPALNKAILIGDYEQRRDDGLSFAGHAVFEIVQNRILLNWWDLMGPNRQEYRGVPVDDAIVLLAETQGGMARLTYRLTPDGRLEHQLAMAADGGPWRVVFDGDYLRYAE